MSTEIAKPEERIVSFTPFGAADAIKLSVKIVQNYLAVPTATGKTCSERDATRFIMFCQARHLNPWEGDAYLVGYDTEGIAKFTLITAEQTFLKRAETHLNFDGLESGLVIQDEKGNRSDVAGEIFGDDEKCIGGWARVHFKTTKIPCYDRLPLAKMIKPGPFWKNNPEHQIVKCARVAVLRRAFNTLCGGLQLAEELDFLNAKNLSEAFEVPAKPNGAEPVKEIAERPTAISEPEKEEVGPSVPGKELGQFVIGEGFTWDHFKEAATKGGWIDGIENFNGFDEIPAKRARTVLRARDGLLKGLQQIREAQSK